jgi:hypothetical protein
VNRVNAVLTPRSGAGLGPPASPQRRAGGENRGRSKSRYPPHAIFPKTVAASAEFFSAAIIGGKAR